MLNMPDCIAGFPSLTIGQWLPLLHLKKQMYTAVIVFFVDFLESISIAKAVARKWGYDISVNKEIAGMGLSNLLGAMFNAYTSTGSFSRTSVSSNIGAKTPLQGIFTGVFSLQYLRLWLTRWPFNAVLTFTATAPGVSVSSSSCSLCTPTGTPTPASAV
jgi:sulfate transporter 4